MQLMLQSKQPGDYLIELGTITSLREFAQAVFIAADLEIAEYLESVETLKRPGNLAYPALHPNRIEADLG